MPKLVTLFLLLSFVMNVYPYAKADDSAEVVVTVSEEKSVEPEEKNGVGKRFFRRLGKILGVAGKGVKKAGQAIGNVAKKGAVALTSPFKKLFDKKNKLDSAFCNNDDINFDDDNEVCTNVENSALGDSSLNEVIERIYVSPKAAKEPPPYMTAQQKFFFFKDMDKDHFIKNQRLEGKNSSNKENCLNCGVRKFINTLYLTQNKELAPWMKGLLGEKELPKVNSEATNFFFKAYQEQSARVMEKVVETRLRNSFLESMDKMRYFDASYSGDDRKRIEQKKKEGCLDKIDDLYRKINIKCTEREIGEDVIDKRISNVFASMGFYAPSNNKKGRLRFQYYLNNLFKRSELGMGQVDGLACDVSNYELKKKKQQLAKLQAKTQSYHTLHLLGDKNIRDGFKKYLKGLPDYENLDIRHSFALFLAENYDNFSANPQSVYSQILSKMKVAPNANKSERRVAFLKSMNQELRVKNPQLLELFKNKNTFEKYAEKLDESNINIYPFDNLDIQTEHNDNKRNYCEDMQENIVDSICFSEKEFEALSQEDLNNAIYMVTSEDIRCNNFDEKNYLPEIILGKTMSCIESKDRRPYNEQQSVKPYNMTGDTLYLTELSYVMDNQFSCPDDRKRLLKGLPNTIGLNSQAFVPPFNNSLNSIGNNQVSRTVASAEKIQSIDRDMAFTYNAKNGFGRNAGGNPLRELPEYAIAQDLCNKDNDQNEPSDAFKRSGGHSSKNSKCFICDRVNEARGEDPSYSGFAREVSAEVDDGPGFESGDTIATREPASTSETLAGQPVSPVSQSEVFVSSQPDSVNDISNTTYSQTSTAFSTNYPQPSYIPTRKDLEQRLISNSNAINEEALKKLSDQELADIIEEKEEIETTMSSLSSQDREGFKQREVDQLLAKINELESKIDKNKNDNIEVIKTKEQIENELLAQNRKLSSQIDTLNEVIKNQSMPRYENSVASIPSAIQRSNQVASAIAPSGRDDFIIAPKNSNGVVSWSAPENLTLYKSTLPVENPQNMQQQVKRYLVDGYKNGLINNTSFVEFVREGDKLVSVKVKAENGKLLEVRIEDLDDEELQNMIKELDEYANTSKKLNDIDAALAQLAEFEESRKDPENPQAVLYDKESHQVMTQEGLELRLQLYGQ